MNQNDLAAEALAACGGDTVGATESILTQTHESPDSITPTSNPSLDSSPSPAQPKIVRSLFQSQSPPPPLHSPSQSPPPATTPLSNHRHGESPENLQKCRTAIPTSPPPPVEPLSERMRPRSIDDVVGQDHLLWKSSLLRSAIDCGRLPSVVLWGPPGTGKTSIARAIVNSNSSSSSYRFVSLSAVNCGVKEVREAVDEARKFRLQSNNKKRTVLFIDEVHRFNKSQQDSFLPVIEDGSIVFMAATTENPSFHLITPLLSRCRVLKLNSLSPQHVGDLLRRAVADLDKGLSRSLPQFPARVEVDDDAIEFLCSSCDGDARVALNALEVSATTAAARSNSTPNALEVSASTAAALSNSTLNALEVSAAAQSNSTLNALEVSASTAAAQSNSTLNAAIEVSATTRSNSTLNAAIEVSATATPTVEANEDGEMGSGCVVRVTLEDAKEAFQCNHLGDDNVGEEHYNLISALQKSMRGNDANASIFWLSRMLEGGELPLNIARLLIRFASEDVGLADPSALVKSVACYQACHFLGMPECNVNLAECVAYLALAPKSVAVLRALEAAQRVVRDSVGQNEGVPLHLRNAPTKLMKEVGYGKGYIYTPDDPLSSQSYLPPSLQGYKFLDFPGDPNIH